MSRENINISTSNSLTSVKKGPHVVIQCAVRYLLYWCPSMIRSLEHVLVSERSSHSSDGKEEIKSSRLLLLVCLLDVSVNRNRTRTKRQRWILFIFGPGRMNFRCESDCCVPVKRQTDTRMD